MAMGRKSCMSGVKRKVSCNVSYKLEVESYIGGIVSVIL